MTTAELLSAITELEPKDLSAILAAVAARLAEQGSAPEPVVRDPSNEQENLTLEEAAGLLRRSTKWLYRHKARLPFIKKIGPRSFVCSKAALLRWQDSQRSC